MRVIRTSPQSLRYLTLIVLLASSECASLWAARFTGEPDVQAKPLSPAEAMASFRVEKGLRVELVASEPLIADPVDISFDEVGRLFVAETIGFNRPESLKPRSRIRLLIDVDGDGRMDQATTFAEDLDYAQGVLAVNGGVIVTTNTGILFLRDTDGDGRADYSEVIFDVSPSAFVDRQMASPRRGLDNWIYINNGLRGKKIAKPDEPDRKLDLGYYNLRYHPATGAYGRSSGGGQFGNTFNDWGHQFFSENRNPAMFAVMPYEYLERNPLAMLTKGHEDVAPFGGDAKVYPLKSFRTTAAPLAGTFSSACGIGAYRGDLLGDSYQNNLFVCEPTGCLVSRWILEPSGPSFDAHRAEPGREFLASTDEWFRPVNVLTGPDGALYVVDMYRRFIDGLRFFPDDYVAENDMGSGANLGRIYRIVPEDAPRVRRVRPLPVDPAKRVALLDHANGWHRDTAQRLLVEAGDASVASAVEPVFFSSKRPQSRLQALWTLEGLNHLGARHVRAALADRDAGVVENALWLASRYIASDDGMRKRVLELATDRNPRVRFAGLLVAGELAGPEVDRLLVGAGIRDAEDEWIRTAILSSRATQSGTVLAAMLHDDSFVAEGTPGRIDLVTRLAAILGAAGRADGLKPVLNLLSECRETRGQNWWRMAVVSGIADGLRRQPDEKLPGGMSELLDNPPAELTGVLAGVRTLVASAVDILRDRDRPVSERVAAIPMLEHLPKSEVAASIAPLLNRREPVEIQQAMVSAISRMDRRIVSPVLYESLGEMGRVARMGAIQYLLQNPLEFLQKIKAGVVNPAWVDPMGRWRFLNSYTAEIRALGREIFGDVDGDRKRVIKRYSEAIAGLDGSVERGRKQFLQTCSVCHPFRGIGNDVGPDISDVRIKALDMLLSDILDPKSTVEPRWETYSLITRDGRTLIGMIESESNDTIVMKGMGWRETVVLKDVESLDPLGTSLMPPNLESLLNEQQMADLLAFLKSDGRD